MYGLDYSPTLKTWKERKNVVVHDSQFTPANNQLEYKNVLPIEKSFSEELFRKTVN